MNILIIENEIYLAQKVVSRLLDDGHSCDYIESPNIDNLTKEYDIVLLSTSLPSSLCKTIIKKYSETSIILLLVSYISDETVTNPIKDGAKDYIMKPFIMDELVRKIYHYKECRSLRRELATLRQYVDFIMEEIDTSEVILPPSFPTLIESNSQKCSDKLVFELSRKMDMGIDFISLNSSTWQKQVNNADSKNILYLTDYHTLKRTAKENLHKVIEEKNCIVCSLETEADFPFRKVEFNNNNLLMASSNIMTINDYVKLMVLSYQTKYPDTELSKKLGISRKSLWEKRKKLGIEKKKVMRKLFLTVFYSGLSPKAPGTVGSFVSLLLALALLQIIDVSTLFLLAILVTVAAVKQIDIYEKEIGEHDSKEIVIDELAGMWIALAICGITQDNMIIMAILAFVYFRIFDIWKPSIIGRIDEKVEGGWGVMGDDVVAGIAGGIAAAGTYQLLTMIGL